MSALLQLKAQERDTISDRMNSMYKGPEAGRSPADLGIENWPAVETWIDRAWLAVMC
jgi:hypothetical protein